MRLPHRLQAQKVKSQGHGAGAYCDGHLAAQLVIIIIITIIIVVAIVMFIIISHNLAKYLLN